jgi:hypothetical protein
MFPSHLGITKQRLNAVDKKKASSLSLIITKVVKIYIIGTEGRAQVRPRPVQYLNSSSHGQDLSSTSGKAEPFTVVNVCPYEGNIFTFKITFTFVR